MWIAGKMRDEHDCLRTDLRKKFPIHIPSILLDIGFPNKFSQHLHHKHMTINMLSYGLYTLTFTPVTLGGGIQQTDEGNTI